MRAALAALMLIFAQPAISAECGFYNQQGQSVKWSGDSIFVDPLYTAPFTCPLKPIKDTDAFTAECGAWTATVVIGYADNPYGADAIVWDNVFFRLKCEKDGA